MAQCDKLLLATMAIILMAGCAQLPKQAFNKEAATGLKALTVTSRQDEKRYDAVIIAHPGASFGLVGAIVAAADMKAKGDKLTAALDPEKTKVRQLFSKELTKALADGGYTSDVVELAEDVKFDDHATEAKKLSKQPSDAILVAYLSDASYAAVGATSDYLPFVGARVKLIGKDGRILYEDFISYGYQLNKAAVHLQPQDVYRFKNIDELVASPEKSREGLHIGAHLLAEQIARDLKR